MIQKIKFSDGGFVLHGIRLHHSVCRFSAWYDPDGNLLDCEKFDKQMRTLPCTARECGMLTRHGAIWRNNFTWQEVSK